jgi:hypothetical protein
MGLGYRKIPIYARYTPMVEARLSMLTSTQIGLGMAIGLALSGFLVLGLVLGAGLPVVAGLLVLLVLDLTIIVGGYACVRRHAQVGAR